MTKTFARNYEHEPFRGYGPGLPRILRLIRAGAAWDEAAQRIYPGGSYGNGSAMRVAPIGVFYHDNSAMLREVAYKSSQITHAHNLGKDTGTEKCKVGQRAPAQRLLLTLIFLGKLFTFKE
ncbi:hypothetical protein ES703_112133 [subsurface metagenome]